MPRAAASSVDAAAACISIRRLPIDNPGRGRLARSQRAFALHERVEDMWHQVRRNAGTVVRHADRHVAVVAFLHVNSQRAAGIRVLRGVVQHVTEGLYEPHAIATNVERPSFTIIDLEDLMLAEDQRFGGFDGVSDDRRDLDVLFVQRNSTLRDARDVEQIDQPIQLPVCRRSIASNPLACSFAARVRVSSSIPFRMAASGLRNSCASTAMNSSFCRSAACNAAS